MSATNAKIDSLRSADTNLPVQARFLAAVSGLNPEILQSLRELSKAQTRLPTQRELKRWAGRWNLGAEWVIDWVAETIKWQREGPNRRWDRFYHPRWSPRSRFERRPPTIDAVIKRRVEAIDFGDWLGDPGTRSRARQRAVRAFHQILRESLEEVGTAAIGSGLFESRRRRSRGRTKISLAPKRSTNEVFLWLACYQTRAWSRGRIAKAVGVERTAVSMAIRDLAVDLKIKLRPNRNYSKKETMESIRFELDVAREHERASKLFLEAKI